METYNFKAFFSDIEKPVIKVSVRGSKIKRYASDGYAYIATNGKQKHKLICYNCTLINNKVKSYLGVSGKDVKRAEIHPLYWNNVKALASNPQACEAAKIKVSPDITEYINAYLSDYTDKQ